jgi:hypothetical protein
MHSARTLRILIAILPAAHLTRLYPVIKTASLHIASMVSQGQFLQEQTTP